MNCKFCDEIMPENTFACNRCIHLCVVVHANRELVRKIMAFYDRPVHLSDCAVAVNGRHECNCSGKEGL